MNGMISHATAEVFSRADNNMGKDLDILTDQRGLSDSFFGELKRNNVHWMDDLFALRRTAAASRTQSLTERQRFQIERSDERIRGYLKPMFKPNAFAFRPVVWGREDKDVFAYIKSRETVHPFEDVEDFRERAGTTDRLCFALYHKERQHLPLIYVVVALTKGVVGYIPHIIGPEAIHDDKPDTAILYSINNCEAVGLRGVTEKLNVVLINQVKRFLGENRKEITNPVTPTLSPMPGFRKWIEAEGIPVSHLDDREIRRALQAHYLINTRDELGRPHNFVSRVHLGNGAIIGALWTDGDPSALRAEESFGAMTSYFYGSNSQLAQNRNLFENNAVLYSGAVSEPLAHPCLNKLFMCILDSKSPTRRKIWVRRGVPTFG